MLRAVIFDFDGVIADSELLHLRAFNNVLAKYNTEITLEDYYKDYLGLNDNDFFKLMIDRLELDEKMIADLIRQKNVIFEKLAETEAKIIEGVTEFLSMLKENDITTAICSGALNSEIELILEGADLRSYFDVIVAADQIQKGKPDPEGFNVTLEKLNQNLSEPIQPEQCVVIEDSHWGLEAAKAADMHTVAVTNSYDAEQLAIAEKVVHNLTELKIEDLQKLCG